MGTVRRSLSELRALWAQGKGTPRPQPLDQAIDYSDAPELTDQQLGHMRRLYMGKGKKGSMGGGKKKGC